MGVLGLWQLLAPVGQPVTLESLENKIFAVDISIWLNQAVKGYRDSTGGAVPNAHLLSLFSRLCKLLFYKIRPIIVFDGGFPELKKQTIINRQQRRAAVKQISRDVGLKILTNYLAAQQLGKAVDLPKVAVKIKEKPRDEIFKLPPLPESSQSILSDSRESKDDFESKFTNFSREDIKYLNQIDIESEDFNALPPEVKQEILSTLKESRKHRTWDQYDELPKESNEFSSYQMKCLLKKRKLQSKLEEVQKDIRKINSSAYVSQYTNDHVIGETNKIMSDDSSYYVLLKKITEHYDSNEKMSENAKSSAMADTKRSFIKDIENIDVKDEENIDVKDESFLSESGTFSKKDNISKIPTKVEKELSSGSSDIEFFVANNKIVKSELKSLDLSDEEYDIDNPPIPNKNVDKLVECIDKKVDVVLDNAINSTCDFENSQDKPLKEQSLNCSSDIQILDEKNVNCTKNQINEINQETLSSNTDEFGIQIIDEKNVDEFKNKICNIKQERESPEKEIASDINHQTIPEIEDEDDAEKEVRKIELTNSYLESGVMEYDDTSISKETPKSTSESINQEEIKNDLDPGIDGSNLPSTSSDTSKTPFTVTELPNTSSIEDEKLYEANLELQRDLDAAAAVLEAEQAKKDRQANTVQDHMIEECKELLQLFGIPYVVSPLEAEAQCAFFDMVDFTHGTITDDSDVWLFGGKRVYKNFFTPERFVESYKDKEIFRHFGLSRKKLVNFALLTGSDYTEGIEGVGPVTAMEIISEFPGEGIDALQKFKEWWVESNKSTRPPENKIRAKLQKLVLAHNFPDPKVVEAYINPEVDSSLEKFTWGRPDLAALRDYTKERFGWNQSKVDGQLLPVLKKLNDRDKQTHLDSFFTVTLRKETNLFPSKRIMSALKKITSPQKQENENKEEASSLKRKTKISGKKVPPKKITRKSSARGRGKRIPQQQGPNLSEESSSDSDS